MLQRKQTLWLFLSSIFGLLQIKFPVYHGEKIIESTLKYSELNASSNIILLILVISAAVISILTIFMFKNRKSQMGYTFLAIAISAGNIYYYWYLIKDFSQGNYSITVIFPLLIPVLLILAFIGILKDERLVKSLDRLR